MILGINTTCDISKLSQIRKTILKYHSWYLCQMSLQIMLLQGSTFRKKSWGQLASKFSFLVARTSILVAKNYLQEKIAYNILKVFLTSTKLSISYLLQNRLHNPYNGTCYKIHFYVFMYCVTVKLTDS